MSENEWRVLVLTDDDRFNGSYIQDGVQNERMRFRRENDDKFLEYSSFNNKDYFTWSITINGVTSVVQNTKNKDSDSGRTFSASFVITSLQ